MKFLNITGNNSIVAYFTYAHVTCCHWMYFEKKLGAYMNNHMK